MPKLARRGALRRCSIQYESGERAAVATCGMGVVLPSVK